MRVLMFGWEYPPHNTGGLGTACKGLTEGLLKNNIEVILILPHADELQADDIKMISTGTFREIRIKSRVTPYLSSSMPNSKNAAYCSTLFEEVNHYTQKAVALAKKEQFDVIHANDWLTFPAAMQTQKATGKPFVAHVHATEFDRSGGLGSNPHVAAIEHEGMHTANKVIAVSKYTRQKIHEQYHIPMKKIEVVYNAVERPRRTSNKTSISKLPTKVVLFLGRITLQKGPDYFIRAAQRVLEYEPDTLFVIAGSGDMESYIIEKVVDLGLAEHVLFTGFLNPEDVRRVFGLADVYVMPSVSEPFGITALESIAAGTPCIISKQSGVSEVVHHCLKVDFWDTEEMANKIVAALRYPEVSYTLTRNAKIDIRNLRWEKQAKKCVNLYNELLCEQEQMGE